MNRISVGLKSASIGYGPISFIRPVLPLIGTTHQALLSNLQQAVIEGCKTTLRQDSPGPIKKNLTPAFWLR